MRFGNRTARTLQCSFSSLKTGVVRAVARALMEAVIQQQTGTVQAHLGPVLLTVF